jgi:hypothetical protein
MHFIFINWIENIELDPCLNNNACGSKGKCVSLYRSFYCDCNAVSKFYTGKYCEKCEYSNLKGNLYIFFKQ